MSTTTRRPVSGTVIAFVLAFLVGLVFFLRNVGTEIPLLDPAPWNVSFLSEDVKNLKPNSEVTTAGVTIGTVKDLAPEGEKTRVVLDLNPDHAPLHQGATVRIGMKSLLGQSYVDVLDGDGAELEDGGELPAKSVVAAVDIDEVLDTLDPETRKSLSSVINGLGISTNGRADEIQQLMKGLGTIGSEGYDVVDALAAQSGDLEALVREATILMRALDTGEGRIASVVRQTDAIVSVTAADSERLSRAVRGLPGLMTSASQATADLSTLATGLAPIAADLRRSAPYLDTSLRLLPGLSRDLNGIVDPLDLTLQRSTATLSKVPGVVEGVQGLVPQLRVLLSNLNPALSYLSPYGRDIGAMFGSFGASMDVPLENGVQPIRLAPVFNLGSARGNPLPFLALDPLTWSNPYPAPGTAGAPKPYEGSYPRVERAEQ